MEFGLWQKQGVYSIIKPNGRLGLLNSPWNSKTLKSGRSVFIRSSDGAQKLANRCSFAIWGSIAMNARIVAQSTICLLGSLCGETRWANARRTDHLHHAPLRLWVDEEARNTFVHCVRWGGRGRRENLQHQRIAHRVHNINKSSVLVVLQRWPWPWLAEHAAQLLEILALRSRNVRFKHVSLHHRVTLLADGATKNHGN